ncbi:MAG: hypothetical protein Q8R29_03895, partial [bacterium]|nr:hypothetical protein [bacterium]
MLAEVILKEAKEIDPQTVDGLDLVVQEFDDEFVAKIEDDSIKQLVDVRQRVTTELQKIKKKRAAEMLIKFANSLTKTEEDVEGQISALIGELEQNSGMEDLLENKLDLVSNMLWAEIRQLIPRTRKKAHHKICRGLKIYRVVEMEETIDRFKKDMYFPK